MARRIFAYTGTYQTQHWFSDERRPSSLSALVGAAAQGAGIGRYAFDPGTGAVELLGITPAANNPATLWVSVDQKYLYAAHETKNYNHVRGAGGAVSAYAIDPATGALTLINTVPSCGTFAAYVTADARGEYVAVANHASYFYNTAFEPTPDGDYVPRVLQDLGSIALFRVRADGGLEEACDVQVLPGQGHDAFNQGGAHPHAVKFTPDDFVIAPNKGADAVDVFRLDRAAGKLTPVEHFAAEPGAAPRHLAVHPQKNQLFIMNEFNNKLVSYAWDRETGRLREVQRALTVPPQYVEKSYTSGDVVLHPGGKFLYGTNHTFRSLVAYRVREDATLELLGNFREGVGSYREIAVDPTGSFLAAGDLETESLHVWRIDPATGWLSRTEHTAPASYPSCLHFAQLDG